MAYSIASTLASAFRVQFPEASVKLEAIKTFFDFFYEDTRYSDWVLMEGFLPATSAGGEIVAASDPDMAPWVGKLLGCRRGSRGPCTHGDTSL